MVVFPELIINQHGLKFPLLIIQVISIASVDKIWKKNIEELLLDLEEHLFPPCFCVAAAPRTQGPDFVTLHFKPSEGEDFYHGLKLARRLTVDSEGEQI